MEIPETRYAIAPDGAYIAYQTLGQGPIDIAWQIGYLSLNPPVDLIWQVRAYAEWLKGLASFSRLILHDRRGTGASSRNVAAPDLETRVADLLTVLDAVEAERPVLGAELEGGAVNVLFAATMPERVHSLFWWYPAPRSRKAPDYPWGMDDAVFDRGNKELTSRDRSAPDQSSAKTTDLVLSVVVDHHRFAHLEPSNIVLHSSESSCHAPVEQQHDDECEHHTRRPTADRDQESVAPGSLGFPLCGIDPFLLLRRHLLEERPGLIHHDAPSA